MFRLQVINSDITPFFLKPHVKALLSVLAEIKEITSLKDRRLTELKKQLEDAAKEVYSSFAMLKHLHKAHIYSQLADYIASDLTASSAKTFSLAMIHALCDDLVNEVNYDVATFKKTVSLLPKSMTKKALIELVNCYELHNDEDDYGVDCLKKYMQTDEFKMANKDAPLRFSNYMRSMPVDELRKLGSYYTLNDLMFEDQKSFFSRLLSCSTPSQMEKLAGQYSAIHEEDNVGRQFLRRY